MPSPSIEYLNTAFTYLDGNLYWRQGHGGARSGRLAGCVTADGYRRITYRGVSYAAHRLVYQLHHGTLDPALQIDHVNGVKDDNRIENLRQVTSQENNFNRTGVRGYSWHKSSRKWAANIRVGGRLVHLGCFSEEENARAAYLGAKELLHAIPDRS